MIDLVNFDNMSKECWDMRNKPFLKEWSLIIAAFIILNSLIGSLSSAYYKGTE
jgi:Iap family predicted aminopeptidase